MQIDRNPLTGARRGRPFCVLACDGCTGLCGPLYMMLNRDEQDKMCSRYKAGPFARMH